MKYSVLLLLAVLSLVVVLNQACTARSGSRVQPTPTHKPTPKRKRFPFRIYGYIKTDYPLPAKVCRQPNECRETCADNQYIKGKYSCPGISMCCTLR